LSVDVGIVSDPEASPYWADFKAFLGPAAARGGLDTLIGENELLWGVLAENEAIGAATARLIDGGKVAEVVLVGGRDFRRWIRELDDAIGRAARDAGATSMLATGRKGWARVLGWQLTGREGEMCRYERAL
jgi:hypothetical protein